MNQGKFVVRREGLLKFWKWLPFWKWYSYPEQKLPLMAWSFLHNQFVERSTEFPFRTQFAEQRYWVLAFKRFLGCFQSCGRLYFLCLLRSLTLHLRWLKMEILFSIFTDQKVKLGQDSSLWIKSSNLLPLQRLSLSCRASLRVAAVAVSHFSLCLNLRPASSPSSAANAFPCHQTPASLTAIDPTFRSINKVRKQQKKNKFKHRFGLVSGGENVVQSKSKGNFFYSFFFKFRFCIRFWCLSL